MPPFALLIDPTEQSIVTVSIVNNADVFRAVGGPFISKRTPSNNLVHYRKPEDNSWLSAAIECGFVIRGTHMPEDFIVGPGVITGSRPFQDSPFWNVNFDYFDIFNSVLFLTRYEDTSNYVLTQPKSVVWSNQ